MTIYEKYREMADKCRQAAFRTTGRMRTIWIEKANELEVKAGNIPLTMADSDYDAYKNAKELLTKCGAKISA